MGGGVRFMFILLDPVYSLQSMYISTTVQLLTIAAAIALYAPVISALSKVCTCAFFSNGAVYCILTVKCRTTVVVRRYVQCV